MPRRRMYSSPVLSARSMPWFVACRRTTTSYAPAVAAVATGRALPSSTTTMTTGTPCSSMDRSVAASRPSSLKTGMSTATVPSTPMTGSDISVSAAHTGLQSVDEPEDRVHARELNDSSNEIPAHEHEQMIAEARRDESARGHRAEDEQGEQSGNPGLDGVLQIDIVQVVLGDVHTERASQHGHRVPEADAEREFRKHAHPAAPEREPSHGARLLANRGEALSHVRRVAELPHG